ncbi:nuclear transport factor 2 family protein [Pendulispora albinea]|uniref:Nuclear transport factor 2 family protein n=1 Tax=Pendulispora albinea TaxID=2741071 RepID=A0ABZ2M7S7_9BACT
MPTDVTRAIIDDYFTTYRAWGDPEDTAAFFSDDADWDIPGPVERAFWIGPRKGRAGVAAFIRDLRAAIEPIRYEIKSIVVDGDTAVVLGELSSRIKSTGKVFESEFATAFTIADGRIVRYRMYEDGYGLARACEPDPAP